jgi:RecA-family ATPase
VTLAWLFGEAQSRGWQNPAANVVRIGSAPVMQADGLVLDISQLHERASAVRWAVKGVIPEQGLGFIFGASGTFKSFIALDYALHRAYGMKWMGRRTKQAIPVYLAAEGGAGLMRRIIAWHKDRGMVWQDCPMRVVIIPLTLRTHAKTLADAIRATGVVCGDLVVDTMSQTFTGNENSNDEVAEFLRVLGMDLRDALKCTVTVVHHSGHSATERPRGASAIIANVDFALGVFRDEKEMLCTVDFCKIKDGERPAEETFQLASVQLGFDEDGDTITSLSARHMANAEDVEQAMQAEAAAGRGGRHNLLLSLARTCLTEKELRKAFYEDVDLVAPDAKKHAFYRSRDWATKNGHFEIVDGVIVHPTRKQ